MKSISPKLYAVVLLLMGSVHGLAQKLERMPADLETDFALSALPPHLRSGASVYLLDPDKGYYLATKGTNGFICFVARTDWEHGEYRNDMAAAISYDAEGAKTIWPSFVDVEEMRASGKVQAAQMKDIMTERFRKGYYKAPARAGLSYMLGPVMRVYDGASPNMMTMHLPHYMFYAPFVTDADIGGTSSGVGPLILGDGKSPHGYILLMAGEAEKAQILEENKALLKRLIDYRPYFAVESKGKHH